MDTEAERNSQICSIRHLERTQLNSDHEGYSGDDAEANSALRGFMMIVMIYGNY